MTLRLRVNLICKKTSKTCLSVNIFRRDRVELSRDFASETLYQRVIYGFQLQILRMLTFFVIFEKFFDGAKIRQILQLSLEQLLRHRHRVKRVRIWYRARRWSPEDRRLLYLARENSCGLVYTLWFDSIQVLVLFGTQHPQCSTRSRLDHCLGFDRSCALLNSAKINLWGDIWDTTKFGQHTKVMGQSGSGNHLQEAVIFQVAKCFASKIVWIYKVIRVWSLEKF